MTLIEMQYLLAVAKYGNLTKAANALFITQPTLSKFLSALEKEYGTPLFTRTLQGYIPTLLGEKCIARANEIVNLSRALDQELSNFLESETGRLTVGFTYMRIVTTLPKALPLFKKRYQNVSVEISVTDSTNLERLVRNGDLELAFLPEYVESDLFEQECIYPERLLLAAPPHRDYSSVLNKEQQGRYPVIDLAGIREETFILQPKWSKTRQLAERVLQNYGFFPETVMELENISACLGLVSAGYGFSFVTESLMNIAPLEPGNRPLFFAPSPEPVILNYCAVYRKNAYVSKYMRDFINIFKAASGESPGVPPELQTIPSA